MYRLGSDPCFFSDNSCRLQTNIDFSIQKPYKTGQFEALYKIPKSSTTTNNNHFPEILLIIPHYTSR